ncbi:TNFAIP3-interacting protein 3 [Spea bombifrons]|uniref:TNFAIP3-interacting protein 3 n=1 Tax=Spea bombifrons TaxID=233779 RepID=UPI002349C71C|nr:TNFAIP3-interacting protein 3 [Spea bombifrons]
MESGIRDIVNGNECHPAVLKAFSNQSPESERCESVELNIAIRKQIQENSMSQMEKDSISKQPDPYHSSLCSLKYAHGLLDDIFSLRPLLCCLKTFLFHFPQEYERGNPDFPLVKPKYYTKTRKQDNMSIKEYEQRIRVLENQKEELLDVNKQWDQQFRRMRQIYEKKVAELKMKLSSCQHNAKKDQDLPYMETADKDLRKKCCLYTRSNDLLNTELRETKEENQLLRKQNALYNRSREHYEQEITRLNRALSDAVNKDNFQATQQGVNASVSSSEYGDMRTQIEVLKQQIQIYEEDFQKERADRQRISEEKEGLLKMNEKLKKQIVNYNPKCQSKPCL